MFEKAKSEYLLLKGEFNKVAKRVLKEKLSTNPTLLKQYKDDTILTHNNITNYVAKFYHNLNVAQKDYFIEQLNKVRDKTIACFTRLNLDIVVSTNLLQSIEISSTSATNDSGNFTQTFRTLPSTSVQSDDSFHSLSGDIQENPEELTLIEQESIGNVTISDLSFPADQLTENNSDSETEETESRTIEKNIEARNMAEQTEIEFLNTCSKYLHNNYGGNPLQLQPFIKSIKLLQRIQGRHADVLLEYVMTKLEGRALEAVPQNVATVNEVIAALEREIKPDSSDVIEGRMTALKFDNRNVQDFSKTAEELAEALERSLVVEGMTQQKAREMTIKNTVKMCRNSARCDLLRSVLASTQFSNPKEVVAKFIVEQATETTERQVLAYRAQRKKENGNFRGRGKNNYHKNNGNKYNSNYNNNSYRSNRGRGNSRGRGRKNYHNNYGQNNQNNSNFGNNNERYVRVAENVPGPSSIPDWRAMNTMPASTGNQSSFIQYRPA